MDYINHKVIHNGREYRLTLGVNNRILACHRKTQYGETAIWPNGPTAAAVRDKALQDLEEWIADGFGMRFELDRRDFCVEILSCGLYEVSLMTDDEPEWTYTCRDDVGPYYSFVCPGREPVVFPKAER